MAIKKDNIYAGIAADFINTDRQLAAGLMQGQQKPQQTPFLDYQMDVEKEKQSSTPTSVKGLGFGAMPPEKDMLSQAQDWVRKNVPGFAAVQDWQTGQLVRPIGMNQEQAGVQELRQNIQNLPPELANNPNVQRLLQMTGQGSIMESAVQPVIDYGDMLAKGGAAYLTQPWYEGGYGSAQGVEGYLPGGEMREKFEQWDAPPGIKGFYELLGSILYDPINLIPIGGPARKVGQEAVEQGARLAREAAEAVGEKAMPIARELASSEVGAIGDVFKVGQTVQDKTGRLWKVIGTDDAATLKVQSESGATTRIGRSVVSPVPEKPLTQVPETQAKIETPAVEPTATDVKGTAKPLTSTNVPDQPQIPEPKQSLDVGANRPLTEQIPEITKQDINIGKEPINIAQKVTPEAQDIPPVGKNISQDVPIAEPPPAQPPAGTTPPPVKPAIPKMPGESGKYQGILGDLQDTNELVTTMNKPDTYRTIANLPGVRNVMKYLNPSAIAKDPASQSVVARAALREEGSNKTIGAFARLEAFGKSDSIWGKLDDAQRLTKGKLKGKSLDEVLTYRNKYDADLTPQQRQWAEEFHNLEEAKLNLLERNGIEINKLSFEEGGEYVGRRVVGRIDPQTGDMMESAFVGTPGPGRPGAKMGAEKVRYFDTMDEAIEQGFRYLPPDEALYFNLKGAYNRIADRQMTDWLLERIPWRTGAAPETLILARDLAKSKVTTAVRLQQLLNRAIRGERVAVDAAITRELPEEANRLKALVPDLQAGNPVASEVQSLTADLKSIVSTNRQNFRDAAHELTKARERTTKTHYGEATVSAPSFSGKVLTGPDARKTADILNKSFNSTYTDFDEIVNAVNKVNSIGRYFALAGDASPLMIQLIMLPFRHPGVWAKSGINFTKALFGPKSFAKYIADNNAIIQKSRNLILTKGGQTEHTEAFRQGGIMHSKLAKPAKFVLEPFQRAFEAAMDTAGIELRKAFDHMATTPQRTAEVEQWINEFRGVTSSARIGVSPKIRSLETVAFLAPRYNRAIAAVLSDIARGGIRGDQARKALFSLMGGMTALATGITLARGEGWEGVKKHLDPTDASNFMTWDVAGQKIGPGSKFRSLMVLAGKITANPGTTVDAVNDFIRGNFSPSVSTGYDLITGTDYIGEPTRGGKTGPFGTEVPWVTEGALKLTKRVVADNLLPIWVQSVLLEGGDLSGRLTRGTAEFFGGRSYPVATGKLYSEKWAKDFEAYNAIPSDPIVLKAAQQKDRRVISREQYRIRNPQIDAKLFVSGQVDSIKTQQAMVIVRNLILNNKIDPMTIKGIQANLKEQQKMKEAGLRDTNISYTDTLTKSLGVQSTGSQPSNQPATQNLSTESQKWDALLSSTGNQAQAKQAFAKAWFPNDPQVKALGPLTSAETSMLQDLYKQYPFGAANYNYWLRTTTRQIWENLPR